MSLTRDKSPLLSGSYQGRGHALEECLIKYIRKCICKGDTCEGSLCSGYLCIVTQKDVLYALHHKAVAQAVWKPEKYKETSHTTCCHYDNQAESFSLISCHSTQHRNPIAFKSYATRPPIHSARLLTLLQIELIGAYMGCSGYSWGWFILDGAPATGRELRVHGGAALIIGLDLFGHSLVPYWTKSASMQNLNPLFGT